MIPITDEERRGWQRRGARNLVELLQAAAEKGLPLLPWRLSATTPTLVGECLAFDPAERRTAFERWAEFLAGHRSGNQAGSTTLLRVNSEGWGSGGGSLVVVTARIFEDELGGEPR